MFSKSQIKFITKLGQKKYREQCGLFIAEGKKAVSELLNSPLRLHSLYTTEDIFEAEREKITFVQENELKKISYLTTPQTVLAVFHIPEPEEPGFSDLLLALDGVRDPGNLGTIIRLCDWFGVKQLICSKDTVDCYNPKVVQATMGSISRVSIHYVHLPDFLEQSGKDVPVYGAFMDGTNVYEGELSSRGILVMGNEANGISDAISAYISEKIAIPPFGTAPETESLNVATASAILLSEFRRRKK